MVGFGDASTICGRDLVVLGSGAAGLTTALTRVHHGLRPLVVEHAERIGGTSARSSGTVRIPGNHHLETRGIHDDAERASLVGDRGKRAMWQAFLAEGRRMLLELETRSGSSSARS